MHIGFVGLWNLLLLWPVFFVLHFTQIEEFELPNRRQFVVLFVNGVVGTVLSEALWLWYDLHGLSLLSFTNILSNIFRACFLTSSVVGTLSISLQIPMAMLFDVVLKHKVFHLLFYVGSLPILLALFIVAALLKSDDSDPLLRFFKIIYRKACHCRRPSVVR